ncbi:type II secretion system F family protein [Oryzihumus leptocrescens]|uniref:Type II secretion system (T2SS) protein F n=1 Tax=Oryzihumus leptocrescens TaxID=297536 RepID=A0A542Z9V7_9MICO|nr:type II secretion system F family protein [Oryzihumus leptocrescens]TQL57129.1 type II secretion system (T2SS) protein F [Oryzihumus leptocrescens]
MTPLEAVLVTLAVLLVSAPAPRLPLRTALPERALRAAPPLTMPDVADTLDLLALALRGGAGIVQAIDAVADRVGPPAADQLRRVSAALRWGVEDSRAWSAVPAAWQPAARALHMAATAGAAPADLLHMAAGDLRRAEAARLEVAASRLGARVVLPLGLAFLPAFALTTVAPVVLALTHQVLGA